MEQISLYENLIDYKEYGDYSNILDGDNIIEQYKNMYKYIHRMSGNIYDLINLENTNNPRLKKYDTFCFLISINNAIRSEWMFGIQDHIAYYIPYAIEYFDYTNGLKSMNTFIFDDSLESVLKQSQKIPSCNNLKQLHIAKSPIITINNKMYRRVLAEGLVNILANDDDVYLEVIRPLFRKYYNKMDIIENSPDNAPYENMHIYRDDNLMLQTKNNF
jgi:hypothetical protein